MSVVRSTCAERTTRELHALDACFGLRVNSNMWLGDISKRDASGIARHVDDLAQSSEAGQLPNAADVQWANAIDDRMRQTLVSLGLVDPVNPRRETDAGRLLEAFLDSYIDGRIDLKPGTKT